MITTRKVQLQDEQAAKIVYMYKLRGIPRHRHICYYFITSLIFLGLVRTHNYVPKSSTGLKNDLTYEHEVALAANF
jgi:hypothetical protein